MSHCVTCTCESRRADAETAKAVVQRLVKEYGSVRQAGLAYSRRYGLYLGEKGQSSGARLFERILLGQKYINLDTLDRIEVFAAS